MAFSPKKVFATDAEAEVSGVWKDLGDGAAVLVARWGNPKHKAEIERLRKPHKGLTIGGRELPEEIAEKIGIESMVNAILLDWKGFEEDGKPLPYSKEKALEYLRDLKDFRDMVTALSAEIANFRKEAMEDTAKNSASG